MDRDLRRSAYISGFTHVALIIAAIVTLPLQPLPVSSDSDVDVTVIGLPPQKSTVKGPGTADAVGQLHNAQHNPTPPNPHKQTETAPPAPPPPKESKAPVADKQVDSTPPPPPAIPNTVSTLPPPPKPPQPQKPTPPKPPTEKPQVEKKPPTSVKSATHQPHDAKVVAPMSSEQLATLLKNYPQKQKTPPKAVYNPDENTAPTAGGSTSSTANSGLTGPDRTAIGDHVRPCWTVDSEAEGLNTFQVLLTVTTDAGGTVREAVVSPDNKGDMSNPLYFNFTQRALAAVLNAQCATLPLPSNMLGSNQTFSFIFTP